MHLHLRWAWRGVLDLEKGSSFQVFLSWYVTECGTQPHKYVRIMTDAQSGKGAAGM